MPQGLHGNGFSPYGNAASTQFREPRSFNSRDSNTSLPSGLPSIPSLTSGCSYATNDDEQDLFTAGLDHPADLQRMMKRAKIRDDPKEEAKASTNDGALKAEETKAVLDSLSQCFLGKRPPGNFSQCNAATHSLAQVATPCTGNSHFAQFQLPAAPAIPTNRHLVQTEERPDRPGTEEEKEKRVKKRKESKSNLEQSEVFRALQDVDLVLYTDSDLATRPLSKDVIKQESERRAKRTISEEDSRAIVVKDKNGAKLDVRTYNGQFHELDDSKLRNILKQSFPVMVRLEHGVKTSVPDAEDRSKPKRIWETEIFEARSEVRLEHYTKLMRALPLSKAFEEVQFLFPYSLMQQRRMPLSSQVIWEMTGRKLSDADLSMVTVTDLKGVHLDVRSHNQLDDEKLKDIPKGPRPPCRFPVYVIKDPIVAAWLDSSRAIKEARPMMHQTQDKPKGQPEDPLFKYKYSQYQQKPLSLSTIRSMVGAANKVVTEEDWRFLVVMDTDGEKLDVTRYNGINNELDDEKLQSIAQDKFPVTVYVDKSAKKLKSEEQQALDDAVDLLKVQQIVKVLEMKTHERPQAERALNASNGDMNQAFNLLMSRRIII